MPLYETDSAKHTMTEIKSSSFVTENVLERKDLQPLLRDALEVIDPDILLLAEEFDRFQDANRRVDLLALDKKGNLVVIELKRVADGNHMELQAVRYAAMLSDLDMDQVIGIYATHNKKDAAVASQEIRQFLDPDVEISNVPRIVLVAPGFPKEVATTVLWLNTAGLDIRCIKVELYVLQGQRYLDLEQVIPLPVAADYQFKIRAKTDAIQKSATSKRLPDSVRVLVNAGTLKPGDRIHMLRSPKRDIDIKDIASELKGAEFTDGIAFKWDKDQKEYTSISALTKAICENLGGSVISINGAEYWALEGEKETLSVKGKNLLLGEISE